MEGAAAMRARATALHSRTDRAAGTPWRGRRPEETTTDGTTAVIEVAEMEVAAGMDLRGIHQVLGWYLNVQ